MTQIIDTPEGIQRYQLAVGIKMLELEIMGLRMSRGPSAATRLKHIHGLPMRMRNAELLEILKNKLRESK